MPAARPSAFLEAWYRWKSLRLPWRSRFLVGRDLDGNTFWEFRDRGTVEGRWRRIVKYPRSTHYSEVKVSPLWHQWLRHTRQQPPSIEEQAQDLLRQERMKLLSAQADARWEAKPRVMDAPREHGQALPSTKASTVEDSATTESRTAQTGKQQPPKHSDGAKKQEDPWERARGPSENWQPDAWQPTPTKKR